MPDSVTVPMSGDQVAVFLSLDAEEAHAKQVIESVPRARSAAAMTVVLATATRAQIEGVPMRIDTAAKTITFTPNE